MCRLAPQSRDALWRRGAGLHRLSSLADGRDPRVLLPRAGRCVPFDLAVRGVLAAPLRQNSRLTRGSVGPDGVPCAARVWSIGVAVGGPNDIDMGQWQKLYGSEHWRRRAKA